jgi:hypothetical protein
MKRTYLLNSLSIIAILGLALFNVVPAQAASVATINFEGLAEGTIVSSVSSGNGISGDVFSGSVAVFGVNPNNPVKNAAMIFDGTCAGGCTGGDNDLNFPALGNILIVSEDWDQSDPDDADLEGAYFTFDYSGFGTGKVTVQSLVVGDVESIESDGNIKLFSGGSLLKTVSIPVTGNGNYTTLSIGVSGVDFMRVNLKGSVAIDNIKVKADEPPGDDGCTPGYWKNHPAAWNATSYSRSQTLESVFNVPNKFNLDDKTLLQALKFKGGRWKLGAARILLRHATAAVLNASHPGVTYPMTTSEIISKVNTALTGSRSQMLTLKKTLDKNNNLGCPLN